MAAIVRNQCDIIAFGKDYHRIRAFLGSLKDPSFTFGRWDWMMKHGFLKESELSRIGIWEEDGEIAAAVLYDSDLGNAHFCMSEAYSYLKEEMLLYAEVQLKKDDFLEVFIMDTDLEFQQIACRNGYLPTTNKEGDAYFPVEERSLEYHLPEGFRIASMADHYDVFQYGQVLFRGFDHEEAGAVFTASEQEIEQYHREFNAPNVNKDLKIVVLDPDNEFAAYCGLWYDKASASGIVEPLAAIPKYRNMGLGKAAVYEGIRRCKELGAKSIFVGSSQQFYYSIGFIPHTNGTYWTKKQ